MRFLITGANGFVGCHMCKLLVEKGEEVFALVRKTSDLSLLKDLIPELKGITLVYGDTSDIESLKTAFKDKDVIISLAGSIKGFNQEAFDKVNVQGNVNVCEAVLAVNPNIKRLILTSSIAAAGPSPYECPHTEETPCTVLKGDMYGISKHNMEEAIKPYWNKIPTMCLVRPPTVVGPGDMPSFNWWKEVEMGLMVIPGKKPHYHSIVYVEDLCRGIYLMATNDKANGQIFYFTSGEPVEYKELHNIIGKVTFNRKKPVKTLTLPSKLVIALGSMFTFFGKITKKPPFLSKTKMIEGVQPGWMCCCDKAKNLLGYQPQETLESSFKKAGDWYISHGYLKIK